MVRLNRLCEGCCGIGFGFASQKTTVFLTFNVYCFYSIVSVCCVCVAYIAGYRNVLPKKIDASL